MHSEGFEQLLEIAVGQQGDIVPPLLAADFHIEIGEAMWQPGKEWKLVVTLNKHKA